MTSGLELIFAYGTLMDLSFLKKMWGIIPVNVEDAYVIGRLYRAEWFPVLIEDPEGFRVYGKLLEIKKLSSFLKDIDYYEGYEESDPESLFIRKRMEVFLLRGRCVEAWVYVGNPQNQRIKKICVPENLINDGRWTGHDLR